MELPVTKIPQAITTHTAGGNKNKTGSGNASFGYLTGYYNEASFNTFLGSEAGYSNVSGTGNLFMGYKAGYNNTANANTFLGSEAGYSNTAGLYNTFMGYRAGNASTADANTFVGFEAGIVNTSGAQNLFMGSRAGYLNTQGHANVMLGNYAGLNNTTGVQNTFVGYAAGGNCTTSGANVGEKNTALGFESGLINTIGYLNTYVGYQATANANNYILSTAIGASATVTASNQVMIAAPTISKVGAWVNWTNYSDARVKKNVEANVPGLEFIKKLRPVTYNYDYDAIDQVVGKNKEEGMQAFRDQAAKVVRTGFIAQEVEAAANELGFNFSGVDAPDHEKDLYGLRYAEFTVPLVQAVQELSKENDELEKKNNDLLALIDNLSTRLQALENSTTQGKTPTGSIDRSSAVAYMQQNTPNPFSDKTVISYFVPETAGKAVISVTSENGTEVMSISLTEKGNNKVGISGNTLKPGVYTCVLTVDGKAADVKKIVLVK